MLNFLFFIFTIIFVARGENVDVAKAIDEMQVTK